MNGPGDGAGPAPSAAQPRSSARQLFWLLLLVAAYFIPRGQYPNPDSHLALTYALVEQHSARIDSYVQLSGSKALLLDKAVYCGPHTDVRRCTRYYSDKAPVVSLIAAVPYALLRPLLPSTMMPTAPGSDRFLLRWLLTILAITVPCALFLTVLLRFLTGLAGRRAALLAVVGYGFGTIALPFSTLMFSHALIAALDFTAFILIFGAMRHSATFAGSKYTLAGTLAGVAIGSEYPSAIIAVLLACYAAAQAGPDRLKAAAFYGAGLLLGLIPLLLYNMAVFGSPISQGYLHLPDPYYAHGMAQGVLGVGMPSLQAAWGSTFSLYRGLFILSPWLLLAFPGLRALARAGYRTEALLCAAIAVCYFTFQSGYAFWDGGASVGPRHFLPAIPFLVLPAAFALNGRRLRILGAALIAVSVAELTAVVATRPVFPMNLQNPLWHETVHDLLAGKVQNNWGMVFGLSGLLSLLPLLLLIAMLARSALQFFYITAMDR